MRDPTGAPPASPVPLSAPGASHVASRFNPCSCFLMSCRVVELMASDLFDVPPAFGELDTCFACPKISSWSLRKEILKTPVCPSHEGRWLRSHGALKDA